MGHNYLRKQAWEFVMPFSPEWFRQWGDIANREPARLRRDAGSIWDGLKEQKKLKFNLPASLDKLRAAGRALKQQLPFLKDPWETRTAEFKEAANAAADRRVSASTADIKEASSSAAELKEIANWLTNAKQEEIFTDEGWEKLNKFYGLWKSNALIRAAAAEKDSRNLKDRRDAHEAAIKAGKDLPDFDSRTLDKRLPAQMAELRSLVSNITGGDWSKENFLETGGRLREIEAAGNFFTEHGGNNRALLSDAGVNYAKTLHGVVSNDKLMTSLRAYAPRAVGKLKGNARNIRMLANNSTQLRNLYAMKQNPLMWLLRSMFSKNPQNFYNTVRTLHTAATDKDSEWGQFLGKDLEPYRNYMPWLRTLYNVRGAVGGSPSFEPIIYRG